MNPIKRYVFITTILATSPLAFAGGEFWTIPSAGARANYVEIQAAPQAKYVMKSSQGAEVRMPSSTPADKIASPATAAKAIDIEPVKIDFSKKDVVDATSSLTTSKTIMSDGGRKATSTELKTSKTGVAVFDLFTPVSDELNKTSGKSDKKSKNVTKLIPVAIIPKLDIGEERKVSSQQFELPQLDAKLISQKLTIKLPSQSVWTAADQKLLKSADVAKASQPREFGKSDLITQKEIEDIQAKLTTLVFGGRKDPEMTFKPFSPLDRDEVDQLSALLLFKKGDECASAISLFYTLSQKPKYRAEAVYHIAACSQKLGFVSEFYGQAIELLKLRDPEYTIDVLKLVGPEVPHDFKESFGKALLAAVEDPKLAILEKKELKENMALHLGFYGIVANKPAVSRQYAKMVTDNHPKAYQARYIEAIAEYMSGQASKGVDVQDKLLTAFEKSQKNKEFASLAAVNLGRLQFQAGLFESASKNFIKVQKDDPLWIQSLVEMGWSQVQSGDYAGAIGNMYSIHSPFFDMVYKPESYVIRSIGYLKLCQYGDAYKSLSILEKQYRPWMESIQSYLAKPQKSFYGTLKSYMKGDPKATVDGLPSPVIREMARHKDFLNLQKALNRTFDEDSAYDTLGATIVKNVNRTKFLITSSKNRIEDFRKEVKMIGKGPKSRPEVEIASDIQRELKLIDSLQFILGLHDRTQKLLPQFVKYAKQQSSQRISKAKGLIESTLANRVGKMKRDLSVMLENNEFLRYEVFAGSGENIRFEIAGGEKADKRVPASVVPKSKELKWSFDGEYWADEIGHYRSSLKSNCPKEGAGS